MLSVVIMLCYNSWRVVRITHKINGILPAVPRVLSIHMINIFMIKVFCVYIVLLINITHGNVYLE